MKTNGYFDYLDQFPNGNEPDNQTICNVENQDEQLKEQMKIPKCNGKKRKRKKTISKKDEHLSTTCTRSTTKSRKRAYGKFIGYTKPQKEIPNPINLFFQKHRDIYELVYTYFDDKVSHFTSQRAIESKTAFVDYALKKINCLIIEDGNGQWQLVGIDYKTFCTNLTKEFIDYYLDKKLEELFIIFQTQNEGDLDHNKKVINYIRSNGEKELFANEYLDKNFYELVEDFNKACLNKYLNEKEGELYKAYTKYNIECEKGKKIIDIDERINAYDTLMKTLCINFRDYSESIQGRKKNKKKKK